MATTSDRLFTASVNWVQGHVFPRLIGRSQVEHRQQLLAAQPEAWQNRLRELEVPVEQLSWGPMTLLPWRVSCLIDGIESEPPNAVLEVGSGASTVVIAALAAKYGFSVVSLENFRGSYDSVKSLLASSPGGASVQLRQVGFVRRRYPDGKAYRWYDIDLSQFDVPFDFVLIDGPSSKLVGRNGALPEISPYLADRHRIYVDDALGDHGRHCLEEWRHYFPGLVVEEMAGCGRMACLRLERR